MAVQVIAEAGVNHNGDLARALDMVEVAKECGADMVKFQTFRSQDLVSPQATMARYQIANMGVDTNQLSMLQALELDRYSHVELIKRCQQLSIDFISSAFDLDSLDMLHDLGQETFKIPSGEITNLPYLERVGALAKRVFMSTGMADMREVEAALAVLYKVGRRRSDVVLLHCTTEYPAPFDEVNLQAIVTIRAALGTSVGYSDHTVGTEVALAAVAMGAVVIEKHFTLDRKLPGPDHLASVEPLELKQLVQQIRNVERALGDGVKKPTLSELRNRDVVRKSLHLTRSVQAGHLLKASDLTTMRPGDGISPMRMPDIVGRKVIRALDRGAKLMNPDLEP